LCDGALQGDRVIMDKRQNKFIFFVKWFRFKVSGYVSNLNFKLETNFKNPDGFKCKPVYLVEDKVHIFEQLVQRLL
jgi:hypothetical protein